jgi:hypothetical protein
LPLIEKVFEFVPRRSARFAAATVFARAQKDVPNKMADL